MESNLVVENSRVSTEVCIVLPPPMMIVLVSVRGKPSLPFPRRWVIKRSLQSDCTFSFGRVILAGRQCTGQLNWGRSIYQPSVFINMLSFILHASVEGFIFCEVHTCRAVMPNIFLRSLVSVMLYHILITPPF